MYIICLSLTFLRTDSLFTVLLIVDNFLICYYFRVDRYGYDGFGIACPAEVKICCFCLAGFVFNKDKL